MGPQPIVKVKVWEDVIPPAVVCSHLILPLLADPMEGILGNLQLLFSVSSSRNEERGYLERRWVMSPPRQQGILFIAESSNVTQEPTGGQQDCWTGMLPKGCSLDDWVLKKRHGWNSTLFEMGQGELMGSICCTWIPFILIAINQSHLSPLLKSYSSNPLLDPKTHFGTSTV